MGFRTLAGMTVSMLMAATSSFADVQVSNFGEIPDTGGDVIVDYPYATSFTTGPGSDWKLNSILTPFYNAGFNDTTISLAIYTDNGGIPGTLVATLGAHVIAPGYAGLLFSPSTPWHLKDAATILASSTTYWLVAESDPEVSFFLGTTSFNELSSTGWSIGNGSLRGSPPLPFWEPMDGVSRFLIDADRLILQPLVTAVQGCTDDLQVTINCPTVGGVIITVIGANFTPTTVILLSGVPVPNLVYISSTELQFVLPPGMEIGHTVTAVDGSLVSFLPDAVSYFSPLCPGDADGNGVVNFADITATLSYFTVICQ